MKNLHERLSRNNPWYKNWHSRDSHAVIHWLLFILVIALAWFVISEQIYKLANQADEPEVTIVLSNQAVISLSPQTATVKKGNSFDTNIILNTGNSPVDGVDIYALHYDPSILKVIDDMPDQKGTQIKPGIIIPYNAANKVDETTGTIIFGQASAGGGSFTGKGILATIHFQAIGEGTSYLKFDFNRGKTTDTNAAHGGKDRLVNVIDAIYTVTP